MKVKILVGGQWPATHPDGTHKQTDTDTAARRPLALNFFSMDYLWDDIVPSVHTLYSLVHVANELIATTNVYNRPLVPAKN